MLHPASRNSMSPRAKPPAPPKLGFSNTVTGAPAGIFGERFRALSTTSTCIWPLTLEIDDSISINLSMVASTYSWRLNVVIATPKCTSRSGAVDVAHCPPATCTPSASAVTVTKRDSQSSVARFGQHTLLSVSVESITMSAPEVWATRSIRTDP